MRTCIFYTESSGKCLSERNAPSSEARSDIFNDARWLYESTEVSFDAYRIIHESSPIQQGGFFHYLIPYDADGNIISPIAKLELNTPREQPSDGLFIRGTSYILLSTPAVVRKLIHPVILLD